MILFNFENFIINSVAFFNEGGHT